MLHVKHCTICFTYKRVGAWRMVLHIIRILIFMSLLCPWETGWGLLKNGTRLIPILGDMEGHSGIKYAVARSTPKVCRMDFPLEVEYAKEISQVRCIVCCHCLYMPCSYVLHAVSKLYHAITLMFYDLTWVMSLEHSTF